MAMSGVGGCDGPRCDEIEILGVERSATSPVHRTSEGSGAIYDHGFGVGDPGAVIYPDRDSGTSERADPAVTAARRCAICDQPDLDAALLCPDQCLDGFRTRCETVSVDKDLRLGTINRIDRQGGAVLLG